MAAPSPDLDTLTAQVRAAGAIDPATGPSISLPPAVFHDPGWFAHERDAVFLPNWIAVARSSALAAPTDYVTAVIIDEPVVVTRDREGVLRALSNVCRHRSMTIVEGSGSAPSLHCPYHQWTYRLDGSVAAAPGMGDHFDPASTCLPEFAVCEWQGWVLVNIDGTAAPIASSVPTLDRILTEEGAADMVHAGTLDYPSPWNWKIAIENFLESYHHRGVHPETLDAPFPGAQSFPAPSGDEPWSAVDHVSVMDDFEPFLAAVLHPTLAFAVLRGVGLTWFRFEPRSATETQLTIEVYTRPDLVELGPLLVESTREINDEDAPINERTAAGLRSRFAEPGPVSPLEGACWQFRRWLAAACDG